MESVQSDFLTLRRVLLKPAQNALVSQDHIDEQWRGLNFTRSPAFQGAIDEYRAFTSVLAERDVELVELPGDENTLDSLYPRDASVICSAGAILCNMGKATRRGEPTAHETMFRELGVPVAGRIADPGRLEGGDVAWIDERTVAVGRGYRTNDAGIRQFTELLGDAVDTVVTVPLPHWSGPDDVFHLMSMFSPVDADLAVVFAPLLPVPFREFLVERGFGMVEVPEEEFARMGCNVLAVGPRSCLMVDGNPVTRSRLEEAGAVVTTFPGDHICLPGGGGPTCLTRPLERGAGPYHNIWGR